MQRLSLAMVFITMAVVLFFSGCGSDEERIVNNAEVFPLPGDLKDIDISYIPYEYAADGCMYRVSYLSMELAARGTPSGAIMVSTCDNKYTIEGQGAKWNMHVTSIIDFNGEEFIIDPLVSSDFLTKEEWLIGINGEEETNININSPAYPTEEEFTSNCNYEKVNEEIAEKVEDMVPWYLENIMISCSYLRRYLLDSANWSKERDEKLVKRTHELINELTKLGLIENSYDEETMNSLKAGPWCPEPINLP